jgi:hypothetical protein
MANSILIDKDEAFELLVQMDSYHELLGVELLPLAGEGFDPDRYYTPLEMRIHWLCKLMDIDYKKVREEAYKRSMESEGTEEQYEED